MQIQPEVLYVMHEENCLNNRRLRRSKLKTELLNQSNFNVMVGRIGDILIKALDKPLGYAINWGRVWSLWPVHLETACCSVEFGAVSGPRYDAERFGIIEAFGSLRQCDLIVVQGTVTRKMAQVTYGIRSDAGAKICCGDGGVCDYGRSIYRFL
jgi:hypothetical protein